MFSLVRCSAWRGGANSEASRSLVQRDASAEEERASFSVLNGRQANGHHGAGFGHGGDAPRSWLLRLGAPNGGLGSGGGHGAVAARGRIPRLERARHAVLAWRLERPYLIYCLACAAITAFLLLWNILKGVQNHWNLPQWKHHRWEEVVEVTIGVLIVLEISLTICVLGVRFYFSNCWSIFDFVVMLLTAISICYGLEHLGRHGEICEANVPLLLLRFVLQPTRVLAVAASTYRTRQMQNRVDELRVDFDTLATDGTAFQHLEEM